MALELELDDRFHVDLSFASVCSILSSFVARSTTSPTSSTNWWSLDARQVASEKVALISMVDAGDLHELLPVALAHRRRLEVADARQREQEVLEVVSQPPKA